jgi:hypothetical protein
MIEQLQEQQNLAAANLGCYKHDDDDDGIKDTSSSARLGTA